MTGWAGYTPTLLRSGLHTSGNVMWCSGGISVLVLRGRCRCSGAEACRWIVAWRGFVIR